MEKVSLKFKLMLGGMVLVVVPILCVGLSSTYKATGFLEENAYAQSSRMSLGLADSLDLVLEEQIRIARSIAENFRSFGGMDITFYGGKDIDETNFNRVNATMQNILKGLGGHYESMFMGDMDGLLFAGALPSGDYPFKGVDVSARDYFQAIKNGSPAALGGVVVSESSGVPVVTIGAPIRNRSDQPAAFLAMTYRLEPLARLVRETRIGKSGLAFLLDRRGIVIAHPDKTQVLKLDLKAADGAGMLAQAMLAGKAGVETFRLGGIGKVAGFAPVKRAGWSVAVTQDVDEFRSVERAMGMFNLVAGAGFLALAILGAWLLAHSLTQPMNRAIVGVRAASERVSGASDELSAASQDLAQHSSEQAASIEETASSLEQMAAAISATATHTTQANQLIKDADHSVRSAAASMAELTDSIRDIANAGNEIQDIVRTIDAIAFQTNLLALNAAVEAARAGDAGAAFGVVADEVRRLATRASEAAKNTTGLISRTSERIRDGQRISQRVCALFDEVTAHVVRLMSLIEEIASAAKEQSLGVQQLNQSVTEMDTVVQRNAVGSEQNASTAETLRSQAQIVNRLISALAGLLGGASATAVELPDDGMPIAGTVPEGKGKFGNRAEGGRPARGASSAPEDVAA